MGNPIALEKINHDFLSVIRNFQTAAELLDVNKPNTPLVLELIRESVDQLKALQGSTLGLELDKIRASVAAREKTREA